MPRLASLIMLSSSIARCRIQRWLDPDPAGGDPRAAPARARAGATTCTTIHATCAPAGPRRVTGLAGHSSQHSQARRARYRFAF